jgi:hypothetical protein
MIFGGKSGRSALLCSGSPFPSSQEGWPERPGWYSGGVPCEAGGGGILGIWERVCRQHSPQRNAVTIFPAYLIRHFFKCSLLPAVSPLSPPLRRGGLKGRGGIQEEYPAKQGEVVFRRRIIQILPLKIPDYYV